MPNVRKARRTSGNYLLDDLMIQLEIHSRWRKAISDNITTKYGSLQGFMEYLFESGDLQPIEELEAREIFRGSDIIIGECNENKTEAYLILSDKNMDSYRLFVCGKDNLKEPEGVFYLKSKSFKYCEK